MTWQSFPKTEVHIHLDCSLSFDLVKRLVPGTSREEFEEAFIVPPHSHDLPGYLKRAESGIQLMQTREQLRAVTDDLFDQFVADHVVYAEIRFAPLEHTRRGLRPAQVVETVAGAVMKNVERTGIEAGLILCTLRHYSQEQGLLTAGLVRRYRQKRVWGFDMAADEALEDIQPHIPAFAFCREHDIPTTAHAGEARGAESVWNALRELQVRRLGHGVRSIEDPELLNYLREHDILLEVCPTSNLRTHVFERLEDHSVNQLYEKGIPLCINTDGRSLSNVTLTEEYQKLTDVFGWGREHFLQCNVDALKHGFGPENIRSSVAALFSSDTL